MLIKNVVQKSQTKHKLSAMAYGASTRGIIVCLMLVLPCVARAFQQDSVPSINGIWQGTLDLGGGKGLRTVFKIQRVGAGTFTGTFYSLDEGSQPYRISSILQLGSKVSCSIAEIGAEYRGSFSVDGNAISGEWGKGTDAKPLVLVRTSSNEAWDTSIKTMPGLMPLNSDPSFEVATIKPNNSGGSTMQSLTFIGRNFATRNSSVRDLISFAYDVHASQIFGGPSWLSNKGFDLSAIPNEDGKPNINQMRIMVRKLLTDRFGLVYHHENRKLAAFVLTVGEKGEKVVPNRSDAQQPNISVETASGGLTLRFRDGTMTDFSDYLQLMVLDRPVVDRTGLSNQYNFGLTWMPNDSQFDGHPPVRLKDTSDAESAPDLSAAIAGQLGLKLRAQRISVDVLIIDHVILPSSN